MIVLVTVSVLAWPLGHVQWKQLTEEAKPPSHSVNLTRNFHSVVNVAETRLKFAVF